MMLLLDVMIRRSNLGGSPFGGPWMMLEMMIVSVSVMVVVMLIEQIGCVDSLLRILIQKLLLVVLEGLRGSHLLLPRHIAILSITLLRQLNELLIRSICSRFVNI